MVPPKKSRGSKDDSGASLHFDQASGAKALTHGEAADKVELMLSELAAEEAANEGNPRPDTIAGEDEEPKPATRKGRAGRPPIYVNTDAAIDLSDITTNEAKLRAEFARRLTERMRAMDGGKGWNQSQLARAADIGRDNISVYLRQKSLPGDLMLSRLATALGCKPDDLLPAVTDVTMARTGGAPFELRELPDGGLWLRVAKPMSMNGMLALFSFFGAGASPTGADGYDEAAGETPAVDIKGTGGDRMFVRLSRRVTWSEAAQVMQYMVGLSTGNGGGGAA